MKRRQFIKASATAGLATGLAASSVAQTKPAKGKQEYYELTTYRLKSADQVKLISDYWQNAMMPALNKAGVKTVGVFEEIQPGEKPRVFVLVPYKSTDHFLDVRKQLESNTSLQNHAYYKVAYKEPAYERMDKSFLIAFENLPQLELPKSKERVFELRRYESSSELSGKQKVKMFNAGGEIAIFKKTGLTPVFFGEAIFGNDLPHLTYMITFKNMEEKEKNWRIFRDDPEWTKLKVEQEYLDTVSNIQSTMLKPFDFSQI